MQGLGKPRVHQVKMIEWGLFGKGTIPYGVIFPFIYHAATGSNVPGVRPIGAKRQIVYIGEHTKPGQTFPKQFIPKDLIHDALLNPPIS